VSIHTNADIIGQFLGGMPECCLPNEVLDAAKRCLVDWVGVSIAGGREPVAKAVAVYIGVDEFFIPRIGPFSNPGNAALLNGVAGHALDFDDTHIPTDSHISTVTWATLLALADPSRHSGLDLLRAFVAGYEVAAKLSGRRFGFSLQFRWFHPTAIIGRLSSSAAASVLLGLPREQAMHAVVLSTSKASGLRGSLGGMGKAMQAGEAAKDGIVCAQMAAAGVEAELDLVSPNGGFIRAFVQDQSAHLANLSEIGLGTDWAILNTSFKPYACLHGIHPSIDAAREVAANIVLEDVLRIRIYVAPGVKKVAKYVEPASPLEAKFSIHFCVAAALLGSTLGADAFNMAMINNTKIRRLISLMDIVPEEGRKMLDSAVELELSTGETRKGKTSLSRGHPGNPMSTAELERKFIDLVYPVRGPIGNELLAVLRRFEKAGAINDLARLCHNPFAV